MKRGLFYMAVIIGWLWCDLLVNLWRFTFQSHHVDNTKLHLMRRSFHLRLVSTYSHIITLFICRRITAVKKEREKSHTDA